jgi:hypothetical protein
MTVDFWASLIDLEVSAFPVVDSRTAANLAIPRVQLLLVDVRTTTETCLCSVDLFRKETGRVVPRSAAVTFSANPYLDLLATARLAQASMRAMRPGWQSATPRTEARI